MYVMPVLENLKNCEIKQYKFLLFRILMSQKKTFLVFN